MREAPHNHAGFHAGLLLPMQTNKRRISLMLSVSALYSAVSDGNGNAAPGMTRTDIEPFS
jgi:hypothetical protein